MSTWDAATVRRAALMATAPGNLPATLRAAHAEATRLRLAGLPVPPGLAEADRCYEREHKREQRAWAREKARDLAARREAA